jgi:NADH dehydrogenase (ubiquinone) 1 alpha subcomplex subunit 2
MAAAWRQSLSKNLRELRIHLCQTGKSSQGVRDFIEKHYVELKQQNPKFPILIRECSGIEPRIYGRYGYGKESSVSVADLSSEQVLRKLEQLATATQ